MELYIDNDLILDNIHNKINALSSINIKWKSSQDNESYYSLLIYDKDTPLSTNSFNSPYVHFLAINLPKNGLSYLKEYCGDSVINNECGFLGYSKRF